MQAVNRTESRVRMVLWGLTGLSHSKGLGELIRTRQPVSATLPEVELGVPAVGFLGHGSIRLRYQNLEIRPVHLALEGILAYPCSAFRREVFSLPTDPILGHGGQTMRSLTSKTKEA